MDKTRVFNCDCLPAMRETPDKFYDLAIVDPPYGIGEDGGSNHSRNKAFGSKSFGEKNSRRTIIQAKKYTPKSWDKPIDAYFNNEYFLELERVSKNRIIWGANHFGNMGPSPCWIVWDKDNSGDFADCELAWTSFDTAVRKFKYRWNGMLQENMKDKEDRIHPTQKPVALYKWLLKNYAKEGDKILDSHVGSGSSRIAAYDMGFEYVGYELDTDYFNAQEKRFNNHKSQLKLFERSI